MGNKNLKSISVLLVGDSHAMSASGLIGVLLSQANQKGYIVTQVGTPFLMGSFTGSQSAIENIKKRNRVIKNLINHGHYKYIILAGCWDCEENMAYSIDDAKTHADTIVNGLKGSINFILKHHAQPVVVLDVPRLMHIPITCGLTHIDRLFSRQLMHLSCYNMRTKVLDMNLRNKIINLKNKYPKLKIIDPSKVICVKGKCYSHENDLPLYFSGFTNSHLNYNGSTWIGQKYEHLYPNPF